MEFSLWLLIEIQFVASNSLPFYFAFAYDCVRQRGRGGLNTGRGGSAGRGRGGGRGRGRGGAQWKKKVEKSADDLDKELESYHAEAMQTW